jgi:hypothetical protein
MRRDVDGRDELPGGNGSLGRPDDSLLELALVVVLHSGKSGPARAGVPIMGQSCGEALALSVLHPPLCGNEQ